MIEAALKKAAEIAKRDLTQEEILLLGIAYNAGFAAGIKERGKDNDRQN